jgi:hypothetical protein
MTSETESYVEGGFQCLHLSIDPVYNGTIEISEQLPYDYASAVLFTVLWDKFFQQFRGFFYEAGCNRPFSKAMA